MYENALLYIENYKEITLVQLDWVEEKIICMQAQN